MYVLQCLTGKVDNDNDRIPSLAGLSRLDHQVWCLVGISGWPVGLSREVFSLIHIYCPCHVTYSLGFDGFG